MEFLTAAEAPELVERRREYGDIWPEFMRHDALGVEHWGALYEVWPAFQFFALDEGLVIAEGNCAPLPWTDGQLPDDGWRAALEAMAQGVEGSIVSAFQIGVTPHRRGQGLSALMLERMRDIAVAHGFSELVAPVRPSRKAAYPLISIDRYVTWRRDDGLLFDPWLRVHERAGASLVGVAPTSMRIEGSVAEWESWTAMAFPEAGDYVVPDALAPVTFADGRGVYVEPNVWMRHTL
jgi:GNAT superfamily N-acetyltransferase